MKHICPRCAASKNASEFTRIDGERDLSRCRSCKTVERESRPEPPPRKQSSRICTGCNTEKHYRAFAKDSPTCLRCNDPDANQRGVWQRPVMPVEFRRFICGRVNA